MIRLQKKKKNFFLNKVNNKQESNLLKEFITRKYAV